MIIRDPLIEPYSIIADGESFNITLKQKSYAGKNKGEEVDMPKKYCHTLPGAIKCVIGLKLGMDEKKEVTLREYISEFKKIEQRLYDSLNLEK